MQRISECLNEHIIAIQKGSEQIKTLNTCLQRYLPLSLRDTCQVGSFNKGCLVLITDEACWASQLRYILPELRDKLRNDAGFYQLTAIKLSVNTITNETIHPKKKQGHSLSLSSKARGIILEGADQCTYSPLKEAMTKLGSNTST